jgi:protocatechuate 3,4-dioxygenase beta subunit
MVGNTFGALVGVITNGSGNPVSGAIVGLWQGGILVGSTTTEEHGFYYFPKVTPGDYEVKYGLTTKPATAAGGDITTVNFP